MLFTIKSSYKDLDLAKMKIIANARRTIALFPVKTAELGLDSYLKSNYGLGLRQMCLKLVLSATYSSNGDGEIIITFIDKELDKIAALITYGNLELKGSDILKCAFCRD